MRKFLKHTVIFLSSLFIIILLLIVVTSNIINDNSSNFTFEKSINYLILGHSHTEGAFNDKLINKTINLSSSGELQFYTYIKIKKIIKENPNIKAVFLGFTNNQITKDMEKWSSDEEKIIYNIPKYSPSMELNDYKYIFNKNSVGLLKSFRFVLKDNLDFLVKGKNNFIEAKGWGGYNYMDKNHIDSLRIAQKSGKVKVQDVSVFSDVNLEYLTKTKQLCKAKGIKLYLLRSPFHKEYLGFKNELLFQETIKNYYPNLPFIDLRTFPLNDEDYRDFDHLNFKGAKKVSLFFNELLEEGIFEKDNYQKIINNRMETLSNNLNLN